MAIFAPISESWRGMVAFVEGVRWLRANPRYLVLLSLPFMLAMVALYVVWDLFIAYEETVFGWVLFARPEDGWLALLGYYVTKTMLYIAFTVLTLVAGFLLANILAAPVYEWVSVAVEKDVTGSTPRSLSIKESAKLMWEEAKKVLFILTVSIVLLFVPVINVIGALITAFLVGWDFYDYPLARRGWSFRRRLGFVVTDFWAVMGFGLWLIIPIFQFVLMPLAIVGGTLLNLEAMQRRQLLV